MRTWSDNKMIVSFKLNWNWSIFSLMQHKPEQQEFRLFFILLSHISKAVFDFFWLVFEFFHNFVKLRWFFIFYFRYTSSLVHVFLWPVQHRNINLFPLFTWMSLLVEPQCDALQPFALPGNRIWDADCKWCFNKWTKSTCLPNCSDDILKMFYETVCSSEGRKKKRRLLLQRFFLKFILLKENYII